MYRYRSLLFILIITGSSLAKIEKDRPKKCLGICKRKFNRVISAVPDPLVKGACAAKLCIGCRLVQQHIPTCKCIMREMKKLTKSKKRCKVNQTKIMKLKNLKAYLAERREIFICVNGDLVSGGRLKSDFLYATIGILGKIG